MFYLTLGLLFIGMFVGAMFLEQRKTRAAESCCAMCPHVFAPDEVRHMHDFGGGAKLPLCHGCATGQGA